MKKLTLFLLFLALNCYAFSQKNSLAEQRLKQLRYYLDLYARIEYDKCAFKDLKLLPTDYKALMAKVDSLTDYTTDSIECFPVVEVVREKLVTSLKTLLTTPKFKNIDINRLKHPELRMAISPDKKLYCFSIDEKNFGSYQGRVPVWYYSPTNKAYSGYEMWDNKTTNMFDEITEEDCFKIHTIKSKQGTKYIMLGGVWFCGSCFDTYIKLVYFNPKTQKFESHFQHHLRSRDFYAGANYNPKTQVININYYTDDLTRDCNCGEGVKITELPDDPSVKTANKYAIVKKCKCKFIFDGNSFKCIESTSRKIDKSKK